MDACMSQAIIQPEDRLERHLIESLKKASECRFAVAYLTKAGLDSFCRTAGPLLKSGTLRLRVVFQSGDFVTEPDAVQSLLNLGIGAPREAVQVSWSTDRNFHAKAYGFMPKNAASPVVVIGSANASKKAFGTNSGELCVRLNDSSAATNAWDAIDRMLAKAQAADNQWLEKYREKFEHHRKLMKGARRVRATWMPKRRYSQRSKAVSRPGWQSDFAVWNIFTQTREESQAIKKAISSRELDQPDIPGRYYTWYHKPDRGEISEDKCVLVLWWRDDLPIDGIRNISVVIPSKPIPLASPETGRTKWWLIPYRTVRSTQVRLRKRHRERVAQILRSTTGKELRWLYAREGKPQQATAINW